MTSKEIVKRAICFENPPRLPYEFPEKYGSDFAWAYTLPPLDDRPRGQSATDEWGAVWQNLGLTEVGEVKDFPLKDWADFDKLTVPDFKNPRRWRELKGARAQAGDKFLIAGGVSLYERVHFIRGLQNTWMDIHQATDQLCRLIDILVETNLYAIERYADVSVDGYMWMDDWGLQDRLMISPQSWRRIWKPRYARVYKAAHEAGLLTFLHSCGNIIEILDDLIEIGLDVIQMDQQENMGLELLGRRFGGRITFWCPVDIQVVMPNSSLDEIRGYIRKMIKHLGRPGGGFMARWYPNPATAGHSQEAIDAMCEEFMKF
ncbi:MAG: uroporphyrinogen decarboxylase family protein [Planctomycetota bacterium]|nr:uroporphyrinogen decarboxylase family protein [Planctomycetota bacterium]